MGSKYRKTAMIIVDFIFIIIYSIAWHFLDIRMFLFHLVKTYGTPFDFDIFIVGFLVALICVMLNRKNMECTVLWSVILIFLNIFVLLILRAYMYLISMPGSDF